MKELLTVWEKNKEQINKSTNQHLNFILIIKENLLILQKNLNKI